VKVCDLSSNFYYLKHLKREFCKTLFMIKSNLMKKKNEIWILNKIKCFKEEFYWAFFPSQSNNKKNLCIAFQIIYTNLIILTLEVKII